MKQNYMSSEQKMQERIKRETEYLLKVIDIMNSNESDFRKTYQVCKMYSSPLAFKKSYNKVCKSNNEMALKYLECFKKISKVLDEYAKKSYFEQAKPMIKFESYYTNYNYAKGIVGAFIESEESYDTFYFLNKMGITEKEFEFCLKIIGKLDANMMKAYENKLLINRSKRYTNNINICMDIANAIENGYFLDGTEFDVLEFWRRVPFKDWKHLIQEFKEYAKINPNIIYNWTCIGRVNNFTKYAAPEANKIIMDFATKNDFHCSTYLTEDELRNLYCFKRRKIKYLLDKNGKYILDNKGNRVIVSDITLDEQDYYNVLEYIRSRDLPLLKEIYDAAEAKYIKGEINLEELKQNKKKVYVK